MTIEQATVKMLSSLTLGNELAKDMIDLAIVSVIGYAAMREIVTNKSFPEYKEEDLLQLIYETEHKDISEMVYDFLKDK